MAVPPITDGKVDEVSARLAAIIKGYDERLKRLEEQVKILERTLDRMGRWRGLIE